VGSTGISWAQTKGAKCSAMWRSVAYNQKHPCSTWQSKVLVDNMHEGQV
jgi:hypothetical protein